MKKKNLFLVLGFLFIIFAITSFYRIYSGVKSNCLKARKEFGGECWEALTKVIQSENHNFRERNSAIWALGQIADKESLPFLEDINRSSPEGKCNHEKFLCKYEVEKAIKWCREGNVTSWMYKKLVTAP